MKKLVVIAVIAIVGLLCFRTSPPLLLAQDPLAPAGEAHETYYAPFSHPITLDGDLSDWANVPQVSLPDGVNLSSSTGPAITFAAAADETNLYLMADVIDNNIVSGKHALDYWNEDSVEFYVNGTGNMRLGNYTDGVAQLTIPPLNADLPEGEVVLAGVRGDSLNATVKVVNTDKGYAIEVSIPLVSNIWQIVPIHGLEMGFQVHLNSAAFENRDSKLIWSAADKSDLSYQNPSLFGKLIFYEIGRTDVPAASADATPTPLPPELIVPDDAAYKNSDLPVEERVEDLLGRMTLDEKIGQMTLVEKNSMIDRDIPYMYIGGLLSGGGGSPAENTAEAWAAMVDAYQELALQSRLAIPLIYGVDAVHGHNNLYGATIFPHNIGLGAAGDADLVERICRATAEEIIATGIYWNYAPVIAVPQDIRWGRLYEGFGEQTDLVTLLGTACLNGLQGDGLGTPGSVLGTPKHYIGDGTTIWGSSTTGDYMLDQGVMEIDEATLREIYLPPYIDAIENGAMNIMISFSSWNETKMHAHDYLINDVLKGELGFEGFTVSDWGGMDQIPGGYYNAIVTSVNAGVDMNMVPYNYYLFISTMQEAVTKGDISIERIDDAVRRILRVKFEMGLFENPFSDPAMLETVGSDEHRAIAREAVSKSAVLLQNNNNTLPIAKDVESIFISGRSANSIGIQAGGWTISWQGATGNTTIGTTIRQAIEGAVSEDTDVYFSVPGNFSSFTDENGEPIIADVGIVVVGEVPYAEGVGDDGNLRLSPSDVALIERMRESADRVVVILLSGRPLIITDHLALTDAFVAAWLPGTEATGLADVLFGDQPFTGKLTYTWPRSIEQIPFDFANLPTEGCDAPLFPYGYGLDTSTEQVLVLEDCSAE